MKKLTSAISIMTLLALLTNGAWGVYLENVPETLIQPDGPKLSCFISGDEFYHRVHDAQGYTIIKDPVTGFYVYAQRQGEDLVPSSLVVGRDDPSRGLLAPGLMPSPDKIRQIREALPYMAGEGAKTPPTGTINNLVVFVRFKDQTEFADSIAKFDRTFNSAVVGYNSLRNYFQEASYGATLVSTTFYPLPGTFVVSYQDTFVRNYFCPYDASTNPIGYQDDTQRRDREHGLLKRTVDYIASQVPAGLDIDADDDGYVDNVCFVVRGPTTAWATLLWSHRWALYSQTAYINSKRVWDYNFQMETQFSSAVLCHEMGHSFGYPDLYHYYYGTNLSPTGIWDVMCSTPNPPTHSGAYMKYRYTGWIASIPQITSPGTYWLKPLASGNTGVCYQIASPFSSSEYFVLEYRRKTGTFDGSVPGSGLLVYRINSNFSGEGNAYYNPAGGIYDEIYLFRLGGDSTVNGTINSAHFSSNVGRTQINDTTATRCFLHHGGPGGIRIQDIGAAGDSICFTVTSLTGVQDPEVFFPLSKNEFKINFAPNPCPGQGCFSLNLGSSGHLILAIYNLNGQRVRLLSDIYLPAGRQSVFWDGRDDEGRRMTPGIYFYRAIMDDQVFQGKISHLR